MFPVRIEKKEKTDEIVSSNAIMAVNSSIRLLLDLLPICSDVIMNRQMPSKFDEVLNICCEVLLVKLLWFWVILFTM